MGAISKFMFEQSFDGATQAPAVKPRKNYTPAEYDAAVAAAREEGHEAGRAEAVGEAEQVAAIALKAAGEQLKALMAAAQERQEALTQEMAKAVATMARKLLPAFARKHGVAEIEGLVAECLGRLHEEPRIVVRVNDEVLDPVRQRLDALAATLGFAGRFVLLAADDIVPGDARVEWADGGVERDTARGWQEIETAVREIHRRRAGARRSGPDTGEVNGRRKSRPQPARRASRGEPGPDGAAGAAADNKVRTAKDLEAVYDIPVQVSAVLGRATMQVSQLLKLGRGAVVELDRKVGEAIDIYVNNRLVARGEVVVVDERLGVTMTEIVKAERS